MPVKGKTNWYSYKIVPVRTGYYECLIRLCSIAPAVRIYVEWDGDYWKHGKYAGIPVLHWRGMTRKAADKWDLDHGHL